MEIELIQTQFDGGIASDSKTGLTNSCRFSRNLDIWTDADSVRLNPAPAKDSASVVTDLVKCMAAGHPFNSTFYAYGDTGKVYTFTPGSWTELATISTSHGNGMALMDDYIYLAADDEVSRLGPLSNSISTITSAFYTSTDLQDQSNTDSGQTYTLTTGISEAAANVLSFTPTMDPMLTFRVNISAKGTGNWTLVIHDANNLVVATKTIANASLAASGNQDFTFSSPYVRLNIGQTYHAHLYSSVADGIVVTGTASDFSDAQFYTFAKALVVDTDYHPMITHTNGVGALLCIGNEHYIATYDGGTYRPNHIELEPGFKVRHWSRENEFILAWAWRGSNIDDFEEGRIFYWNGIDPYYNYAKPITDGTPNTGIAFKNRTFSILGSKGDLALGTEPFRNLQPAPKLENGVKVEVLPEAITTWQRRVLWGYSNTDDTNSRAYNYSTGVDNHGVEQGIYAFGSDSDRALSNDSVSAEVLNFMFSPSTEIANATSFKIGCVQAYGKDLYYSVKDGSSYYVDRVRKSNNACATGSYESLIIDLGVLNGKLVPMPQKEKMALKIVVTFELLEAGCSVTPKYRKDRATNWTLGTAQSTDNTTSATLSFDEGGVTSRYKEIEIGFDLASASGNQIVITSLMFVFDPLKDEHNYAA